MKLFKWLSFLSFNQPISIPKIEIPPKINHLLDSNWDSLEPEGEFK